MERLLLPPQQNLTRPIGFGATRTGEPIEGSAMIRFAFYLLPSLTITMHPNVYYRSRPWAENVTLHVAAAYANPCRWVKRRELANDFRHHMGSCPNVVLHMGELAYGDRPFEVTDPANPLDVQFRTSHELWHKENLLNLVIQRFPPDWQYGCILDADFHMSRHDWALETIHQLQHYDWVQPYSSYACLSAQHRPSALMPSFAWGYHQNRPRTGLPKLEVTGECGSVAIFGSPLQENRWHGATGGAWAFRRSAFDAVGGLLDTCILGSADWHMAMGLFGEQSRRQEMRVSLGYARQIHEWQERAQAIKANVGYVDNHALHDWHGPMSARAYTERWQILRANGFDPGTDLSRNWQGVLQLAGNKPRLRDDVRAYFRARNEDDPNFGPKERHLV